MAKINDIQAIIMSMRAQTQAQSKTQAEAPAEGNAYQTNGTAALAPAHVEAQGVAEARPDLKIITSGKTAENQAPVSHVELANNSNASSSTHEKMQAAAKMLVAGQDYTQIKGIRGNVLLKSGALKLLRLSGCQYRYAMVDKTVDVAQAYIGYTVMATIIDANGEVVAEALASANSQEKKFADRGMSSDSMLVGIASKRALVLAVKAILG